MSTTVDCLVDGEWGWWTAWSACSVSCYGGTRERTRPCAGPFHGGTNCTGEAAQQENCGCGNHTTCTIGSAGSFSCSCKPGYENWITGGVMLRATLPSGSTSFSLPLPPGRLHGYRRVYKVPERQVLLCCTILLITCTSLSSAIDIATATAAVATLTVSTCPAPRLDPGIHLVRLNTLPATTTFTASVTRDTRTGRTEQVQHPCSLQCTALH
jgi:hypothetical protein